MCNITNNYNKCFLLHKNACILFVLHNTEVMKNSDVVI